ncbi:MAG: glycine cleavage system protein GcvH [Dehalococcoidia bacterium]|nr:glycine cleavage system protein GcvH [Dehalococcoidia bacterium]
MNPKDLKYSKDQTWVRVAGDEGTIGITDYAQKQLGSVLFVEVKQPGEQVKQGQPCGTIESDKATSDIVCPVSGEVVAVNSDAIEAPESVNQAPYEAGWLLKVRLADKGELGKLLSATDFEALLSTLQK